MNNFRSLAFCILFCLIGINHSLQAQHTWSDVKCGTEFSMALDGNGAIWTWGINLAGQLGNGTMDDSTFPIKITDESFRAIEVGALSSYAIDVNNYLWAWGLNGNGQLGIGNTDNQLSPVMLDEGNEWWKIAAGQAHALAIKSDSSLYAWGYNVLGQLGTGNATQYNHPVQAGNDADWKKISAATGLAYSGYIYGFHSIGIKNDSSSLCAVGANYGGQLGDSTTVSSDEFNCSIGYLNDFLPVMELEISVFPNPTDGDVFIQTDVILDEIRIYNASSSLIYQQILKSDQAKLSLGAYPPGVYYMWIKSGQKVTRKRILVIP